MLYSSLAPDSRIDPNLLTQTEPGELFVIRNAGNIVPPYSSASGGEAATIEYAVNVLGVRDAVVCGHSHCGAMAGLLDPAAVSTLPAVQTWLVNSATTLERLEQLQASPADAAARLTATVEQNVLVQLDHLRSHPSVAAALGRGELNLHGWVYHFETGDVTAYDAGGDCFTPLVGAPSAGA